MNFSFHTEAENEFNEAIDYYEELYTKNKDIGNQENRYVSYSLFSCKSRGVPSSRSLPTT